MDERIKKPEEYLLDGSEPTDDAGFRRFLDNVTDVPESEALNPIRIDEAGITAQSVYVEIDDIRDPERRVPVLCDVTLSVGLEGHRGIHMSRCLEVLFRQAQSGGFADLDAFALAVARELRELQSSKLAVVKMSGVYLDHRLTRISEKDSFDRVILLSEAVASDQGDNQKTGLTAYNMTACPCTRTYTRLSVLPRLRELGFDVEQINNILETVLTGTHTQRGTVTVVMEKKHPEISTRAILDVLDETTHLVNELLKRPDEHDLVVRALKRPQFTEDVVRDVAEGIFRAFEERCSGDTRLFVESVLNDSIHIHDVRTVIDTDFDRIRSELNA